MEVGNMKQLNNIVFFAFHVELFCGVGGAMSNVCCERDICSELRHANCIPFIANMTEMAEKT